MNRPSLDDMKAMGVMEYVQELEKENKRLEEERDKLKIRIYKNIDGNKWKEYQEFCRENNI